MKVNVARMGYVCLRCGNHAGNPDWCRECLDWSLQVSKEVKKAGGKAERELGEKCKWEHMSRMAVILEWGDPRKWR